MLPIKKVYGYVTRMKEDQPQVLVFQHSIVEAGVQIPKGTVKPQESTYHAITREIKEETGLCHFEVEYLIVEDYWENDDETIHHRFFYKINVSCAPNLWDHEPTGGGDEEGLTFHYFWITSKEEVELIRGHGDYLDVVFT